MQLLTLSSYKQFKLSVYYNAPVPQSAWHPSQWPKCAGFLLVCYTSVTCFFTTLIFIYYCGYVYSFCSTWHLRLALIRISDPLQVFEQSCRKTGGRGKGVTGWLWSSWYIAAYHQFSDWLLPYKMNEYYVTITPGATLNAPVNILLSDWLLPYKVNAYYLCVCNIW